MEQYKMKCFLFDGFLSSQNYLWSLNILKNHGSSILQCKINKNIDKNNAHSTILLWHLFKKNFQFCFCLCIGQPFSSYLTVAPKLIFCNAYREQDKVCSTVLLKQLSILPIGCLARSLFSSTDFCVSITYFIPGNVPYKPNIPRYFPFPSSRECL